MLLGGRRHPVRLRQFLIENDNQVEDPLRRANEQQQGTGEADAGVEKGKVQPEGEQLKEVRLEDGKDGGEAEDEAAEDDGEGELRLHDGLEDARAEVVRGAAEAGGLGEEVAEGNEEKAEVAEDEDVAPQLLYELVVQPAPLGQLVGAEDELIADDGQGEEEGDANGNRQSEHAQLDGHPVGEAVLAGGGHLGRGVGGWK